MRVEQLADNVTLYLGDSRDIIPTLTGVDAMISDPPYGIEEMVGGYGRTQLSNAGQHDRHILNDKNLDCMIDVFNLVKEQFKDIWVVAFYSPRILQTFMESTSMLDYFGEVIWDKRNVGLGNQIRYQHESIAFFKVGEPRQLAGLSSVLTYMSIKDHEQRSGTHPHEKPNQVMTQLCSAVPGKLILDPFMGTGSTGAAAVQLKRGFVGIELEPKYFDVAIKKVNAAIQQPQAFWD